jgi:hypothetical protein
MRDYLELTKPRITLLILICTAVGYWFGCGVSFHGWILVHALLGTALLASGTSALNQWYEVDSDAKMRRTRQRPLPAGRIKRTNGLAFGLLLSGAGYLDLWIGTNALTAALGLFTLLSYLLLYTPLKQRSSACTIVGTIPGAMPHSEYGLSAFDRKHRYVVFFNYDIPWFRSGPLGNTVLRRSFGGWTLNGITSAQSGQPFTILTGVDSYGVGSTAARPNYNPNGTITLDPVSHNYRSFTTLLNGSGIVVTPLGLNGLPLANSGVTFGNLGKNTFRGPGLDTQNLTIAKKIVITERVNLELRTEFFDLFNHRNFLNPVVSMSSTSFGQNTSDPGGRTILLSGRIRF